MSSDNVTILALTAVAPGTRLANAVHGSDGQVLLTAGTVLTEGALEKLATRGVTTVTVERQRSEAELNVARDAARQRLAHLFRRCDLDDAHGAARLLFEAVLDRRLGDLQ